MGGCEGCEIILGHKRVGASFSELGLFRFAIQSPVPRSYIEEQSPPRMRLPISGLTRSLSTRALIVIIVINLAPVAVGTRTPCEIGIGVLSISHDVTASGQFRQKFGSLFPLAKLSYRSSQVSEAVPQVPRWVSKNLTVTE